MEIAGKKLKGVHGKLVYGADVMATTKSVDKVVEAFTTQSGIHGKILGEYKVALSSLEDFTHKEDHTHPEYAKAEELLAQANAQVGVFRNYVTPKDIKKGNVQLPWSAVTDLPEHIRSLTHLESYKGFVAHSRDLPTEGVKVNDVFVVGNIDMTGMNGIMSVANISATTVEGMYSSPIHPDMYNHASMKGREDKNAHPQYMLTEEVDNRVLHLTSKIKSRMGIEGRGYLLTNSNLADIKVGKEHAQVSKGNPHRLTHLDVNSIENASSVIKAHHLSKGITTDDIREGANKYVTSDILCTIASVVPLMDMHASLPSHINDEERSSLLSGADTAYHFHSADRDLTNSTGVLPDSAIPSSVISSLTDLEVTSNELVEASHSSLHTLDSHTDVEFTSAQVEEILSVHSRKGTAHNASFGLFGEQYGVATTVSRSDHTHDDRYSITTHVISKPKPEDQVGSIRADSEFLYVKLAEGYKKVKLLDM